MNLSREFYEDEIRDGFYVPAQIKKSWAISMEVISEIDKICKKHSIKYFADYGTLLGAVRHGGPIPWDDDYDICMLRKDYEKFLKVAPQELPKDYAIENLRTHEEEWDFNFFLARVINRNRICFDEEHLRKYHGFPYMVGTDIFVIDNISDEPNEEEERIKKAFEYIAKGDRARTRDNDKDEENRWLLKAEQEFARFDSRETKYVSEMIQFGLRKQRYFKAEQYKEIFWLPFENMKIPVPGDYLSMIRVKYGDYLTPLPDRSGHDYPFFEGQQAQLEETMGFKIPSYSFSKEDFDRERPSIEFGRKNEAKQYLDYLIYLNNIAKEAYETSGSDAFHTSLVECQNFAIDFGNWIEKLYHEGYTTVSFLEKYCNQLFFAYENVTVEGLDSCIEEIRKSVVKDILERREVVFLPFKAKYWEAFETEYQKAVADEKTDVYVVPIPYYYKDWDGTLIDDAQYNLSDYPKSINAIHYESFDFELHQPEVIYIQNPYDEWNAETSIHPAFYSKNLWKYTEKIVYIPWFKTTEFTENDERAYHNMKYYCTMPGVIHADEIVVQSENIRRNYISKLSKFAGEETKKVWEKRILVAGINCSGTVKKDSRRERRILFSICPATATNRGKMFFEKLENILASFYENRDKVTLVWYYKTTENELFLKHKSDIKRLNTIFEKYCNEGWGEYSQSDEYTSVADDCDAYYGYKGKEAYYCHRIGLPVMLINL